MSAVAAAVCDTVAWMLKVLRLMLLVIVAVATNIILFVTIKIVM